jgi:hypothetical protein
VGGGRRDKSLGLEHVPGWIVGIGDDHQAGDIKRAPDLID